VATDVVFYLKSLPRKAERELPWPRDVRLIAVDPGPHRCGGADPLCSSAYSRLWQSLKDANGQVMPNFLRRFAKGIDVGRVAFVGFSASHGLLNPLANNDRDRAMIDAYVLMDATFGGGKTGYQKFARDAASGKRLLVTTTAHTGGDDSWRKWVWEPVLRETGRTPNRVEPRGGLTDPSGGAWQLGSLLYYLRYVDARGQSEVPHWEQGKLTPGVIGGYLLPYFAGRLGFSWGWALGGALGLGAVGYGVAKLFKWL
jgi:hypothetical protein